VEGENAEGVVSGIEFLRSVAEGRQTRMSGDVVVIGGGSTAFDVARTALRLGADRSTIAYRRTRGEMPAHAEEITEAEEEGVALELLASPARIHTERDGDQEWATAIELQRMELGAFDSSGRRRPMPIDGDTVTLPAATVVRATGQQPVTGDGFPATGRGNRIEADRITLATSLPGVFAGGDVVLGPATVVEAIGQGRRAAEAIEGYLHPGRATRFPWWSERELDAAFDAEAPISDAARVRSEKADPRERAHSFTEVEGTLSREEAVTEAGRCLRCDYGKQVIRKNATVIHVEWATRRGVPPGFEYDLAKAFSEYLGVSLKLKTTTLEGLLEGLKTNKGHFVAAGIYYLSPEFCSLVPPSAPMDMPELLNLGRAAGLKIGLFPIHEYWRDVGHPHDLEAADREHGGEKVASEEDAES